MKRRITKMTGEEILVDLAAVLLLALMLGFLGWNWLSPPVLSWSDPAATPPQGDRPTPILESGNQTRSGDLEITGDATTTGNLSLVGNSFAFPGFSGASGIISDQGTYLVVGSSANRYFVLVTEGTSAGRLAIGNPAATNPAETLRVDGTAQITGDATTTGVLTLNAKANACRKIYYTNTSGEKLCCDGEAGCSASTNYYWTVAVHDTSGVIQNPSPPPIPAGYMVCCKRY